MNKQDYGYIYQCIRIYECLFNVGPSLCIKGLHIKLSKDCK